MIKNAVILNPGYPNVTKLARAFFEEQTDWDRRLNSQKRGYSDEITAMVQRFEIDADKGMKK